MMLNSTDWKIKFYDSDGLMNPTPPRLIEVNSVENIFRVVNDMIQP